MNDVTSIRSSALRTRRRAIPGARILAVLAGFTLGSAVVLGTAAPASAHDELLSSTPTAQETLDSAPAEIVLTFSGNILAGTAIVAVVDSSGSDHITGPAQVVETSVTAPVAPGTSGGAYELRWQVTSEDGHPISGIIPFTIAGEETVPTTAVPSPDESGAPSPESTPAVEQDDPSSGALLPLAVAGAAVVVAVAVVAVILMRRRPAADAGSADRD